jgi:hypothetical protein
VKELPLKGYLKILEKGLLTGAATRLDYVSTIWVRDPLSSWDATWGRSVGLSSSMSSGAGAYYWIVGSSKMLQVSVDSVSWIWYVGGASVSRGYRGF